MCRLFGFRSTITSQLHSSLVSADNTLHDLSEIHPDGWGLAYYVENTPHVMKSVKSAMEDKIFQRVTSKVTAQTVLAHIRKATQGNHTILNSHPFQYGRWVFAHNGNIKNFEEHRDKLKDLIANNLKSFILGTTDSEIFFFIILSQIQQNTSLTDYHINSQVVIKAVNQAVKLIQDIIGPLKHGIESTPTENYLSFILTSGQFFCAFNGGQDLYFCTYKSRCPERETCKSFNQSCEGPPAEDKKVNHIIFSSEKIAGPNIWQPIPLGVMIGVNEEMELFTNKINVCFDLDS